MADLIHVLSAHVANQIAAGEVIQRPASVIKELLENSLDAGATQIDTWVEKAGKSSIQVVDNGQGMSPQDAELAFKRHATSKIASADDLFRLHTFGFRGEALASIAAVAQVTLQTRAVGDEIGVSVSIAGSKFGERKPMAMPVGANFKVRNLFYNVPARRRFLKSDHAELTNILSEFARVALAHPDIGFTFYSDGKRKIDLHADTFRKRIVDMYGLPFGRQLIPFEAETPIVKLSGFTGTPQSAKARGVHQFFFVNGRYMKHAYFHRAVMRAYDRLIPPDKQVPYFCCFDVAPTAIDVNIHPTKTEIKFEDDHAIWQILLAAIRSALAKFDAVPSIDFNKGDVPEIPTLDPRSVPIQPRIKLDPSYNPFSQSSNPQQRDRSVKPTTSADGWEELYRHLAGGVHLESSYAGQAGQENLPVDSVAHKLEDTAYIQHNGRYIVTSVKSGLMLIDQHRAGVRILYDRFFRNLSDRRGVSQSLLFPEYLQVPVTQISVFTKYMEYFGSLGFELGDEGDGRFAIKGVPSGIGDVDAACLLGELFEDMLAETEQADEKIYHAIALSLARRSAVPYGRQLLLAEMRDLVNSLFECASPNYGPDGKVILTIVKHDRLDDLFK